jgi:hypothetical protein
MSCVSTVSCFSFWLPRQSEKRLSMCLQSLSLTLSTIVRGLFVWEHPGIFGTLLLPWFCVLAARLPSYGSTLHCCLFPGCDTNFGAAVIQALTLLRFALNLILAWRSSSYRSIVHRRASDLRHVCLIFLALWRVMLVTWRSSCCIAP